MKKKWIILVAGGSGGHIFPAEATARHLKKEGYSVGLMTDDRGSRYVQSDHFQSVWSLGKQSSNPLKLLPSLFKSFMILKQSKPNLVWGFGGHSTAAPILAARLLRIPSGIYEADMIMGVTNRWLSRLTQVFLATGFSQTLNIPKNVTACHTGIPIRPDIEALAQRPYTPPTPHEPFRLLVLGGSQGAAFWSDIMPKAIFLLSLSLQKRLVVTQQCRPELIWKTQAAYGRMPAKVVQFITDMPKALNEAHLVFSRAGASSIAELMASARPNLLVPYAFTKNDHQTYNAQQIVHRGGGWSIPEAKLTPQILSNFLQEKMSNPEELRTISDNLRNMHQPHSAQKLVRFIENCLKDKDIDR